MEGLPGSFTARYHINRLVYCEHFGDIDRAIAREKEIKRLTRRPKVKLIESSNPHWYDLLNSQSRHPPNPGFLVYLDRSSKIRSRLGALARGFLGPTRPRVSRMRRATLPGVKPGRSTEPPRGEFELNCKEGS